MRNVGVKLAAAPLALALVATACIGGGVGGAGSFVVAAVTGAVRLLNADGDASLVGEGTRVSVGDRLEVGPGGSVAMRRGGASSVELRPTREVNAELRVEALELLEVGSGDVLVVSEPATPIGLGSDGITVNGQGVYRFDRSLSVRVGVYEGTATVEAPSGSLQLPALRQGVIAGRVLPRVVEPLRLRASDPWDQRLLPEVLDLDRKLEAHKRGYQAEFGRRVRSVTPLREIAGGASLRFLRPFRADHSSGDMLVGLVLSVLVAQRDDRSLGRTFRSIIETFENGATWGLLALEHGVTAEELTDAMVRAIALRTGDVEPGTNIGEPTPTQTQTSTLEPSPDPSPTDTDSPKPSPSPSPSPTESPSPSPDPTEDPSPSPSPCIPLIQPECPPL